MKKIFVWLLLFLLSAQLVSAKNFGGTINDLLRKKQTLKCTYNFKADNQTLKGVMYTANNKYRSEFKMKVNNKIITTYSLSDGQWLYNWTSENNQGTKMNLKEMQKLAKENNPQYQQNQNWKQINKDLKTKYQFRCQGFKPKANFFKVPVKISFTDLSQMLNKLEDLKQDMCGICNNLPTEAKEACLQNCQ